MRRGIGVAKFEPLGIEDLQEGGPSPEADATLGMMRRNVDVQSRLIGELSDFTTLGQQRASNYALQPMSRQTFVETVTAGLGSPPALIASPVPAQGPDRGTTMPIA